MSVEPKLSFSTLGHLTAAAVASYVGTKLTGDPHLGTALGAALFTVYSSYLTNRANAIEERSEKEIRASKNHHLQLALAGAFRIALDELRPLHAAHDSSFASWQAILNAALDQPTTLLAVIIPARFDPLLDGANPHTDQARAFEEAESLLRFWLAYQQYFERRNSYPSVPPSPSPELPGDLRQSLRVQFLPAFQTAFANLLVSNDAEYARRAFDHRHLQELVGTARKQTPILERLDAHLLIPLAPLRPPEPLVAGRELEILRAENRAIPVVGRDADLAGLEAWLASPATVSCRILTGPAGAGKTRLAIQLLENLAESRWRAGFLREPELANLNQRSWNGPTLAIVDYAASAAQPLKKWLAHLADQSPAHPLRVLLLEREANPESGWLRELLDHTSSGHRIAALMDPPAPQRVTPLNDIHLRRQILEATLRKASAKFDLPPVGKDRVFDDRLAESRWQDPLYLMMAALVAVRSGGLPEALSLARTDLALDLADRELDRIRKFLPVGAPANSARLLTRLAAIVTACRSLEPADLLPIAKEESAMLGIEFPGGPGNAAELIAEALRRQDKLAPIEPDIIGEATLLLCFGGGNLREGTEALVRAARRSDQRYAANVCSAITRTCQDFASDQCQDPLDWVEEFVRVGQSGDLTLLLKLESQMPLNTLVLRERAARVDQLLLARFTQLAGKASSEEIQSTRAGLANNFSVRLSAVGRSEEALAQSEEAVQIRRQLALQRPDAFLPDLAGSLNNLANMLSDVGRREEALVHAEEAVQIYRQLAQQLPGAFLPNLAGSLNNLANMLSAVGLRDEALARVQEAVQIRRQLAQQLPDAFLPSLAGSLNNLAHMFGAVGRGEEALAHAKEAVQIYRQLAQQRRDAFLPDLAASLNNLANTLSAVGRSEEALTQAEEAVQIRCGLARQLPDAFLSDLAVSLNTRANMLSAVGRREEALAEGVEAVQIRRRLARQFPDAFLPDLAGSLNNLAKWLSAVGRREEALAQAEDAVQIYRRLALQRRDAFLPDLAGSLNNLANGLSAVGRREEALAQAEEALKIYRQLAQQHSDAFLPDLARSLAVRSKIIAEDRPGEAMEPLAEAIRLLTRFFAQSPQAHAPQMRWLFGLYIEAAESAHVDPDLTLLAPVIAVLERLSSPEHS